MLSYGHAMFYGGGGYVAAILLLRAMPQHPNLWLAVLGATLVTAVLALLVGAVTVRLYGIYFALLTLAFAQMVFFIVEQAKDWTNGDDGLQSIPNALLPVGPWNVDLTHGTAEHRPRDRSATSATLQLWYAFAAIVLLLVLMVHARADALAVRRSARRRSARTKSAACSIGFNAAAVPARRIRDLGRADGPRRRAARAATTARVAGRRRSGSTAAAPFVIYTVVGGVQTLFGPVVGTALIMYPRKRALRQRRRRGG